MISIMVDMEFTRKDLLQELNVKPPFMEGRAQLLSTGDCLPKTTY